MLFVETPLRSCFEVLSSNTQSAARWPPWTIAAARPKRIPERYFGFLRHILLLTSGMSVTSLTSAVDDSR
jgi:hypothetical protein